MKRKRRRGRKRRQREKKVVQILKLAHVIPFFLFSNHTHTAAMVRPTATTNRTPAQTLTEASITVLLPIVDGPELFEFLVEFFHTMAVENRMQGLTSMYGNLM